MSEAKIKPCKKCGSDKIKFKDCGYSTFNPQGGVCRACGFESMEQGAWNPTKEVMIGIWNRGQRLDKKELIKGVSDLLEYIEGNARSNKKKIVQHLKNLLN